MPNQNTDKNPISLSSFIEQLPDPYNKVVVNAGCAAIASPVTAPLQNLMVQRAIPENAGSGYFEVFRSLVKSQQGIKGLPIFAGMIPFTARQTLSSGFGYSGTDVLANTIAKPLPAILQPLAAGTLMGGIESLLTAKSEQMELAAMAKGSISLRNIMLLTSFRNSFGWVAGEYCARAARDMKLSEAQSASLGFAGGLAAGVMSMPIQNTLSQMAANNSGDIFSSLKKVVSSKVSLAGAPARAGILGLYTGAATWAAKIIEKSRPCHANSVGRGVE